MGNTWSCCFRGSSRERQKEDQRHLKKDKWSQQASYEISEEALVSPDTSTTDSSETLSKIVLDTALTKPDLLGEVSESEVVPGHTAVPKKAGALATQVTPDAGASRVVTDVKAASAVDNGTILHLQEMAAIFVSELLADAIKLAASEYPGKMTYRGDVCLEPCASPVVSDVLASSAVEKSLFQQQQETAAKLATKVLANATEIVASRYLAKENGKEENMEGQAVKAKRLDPTETDNLSVITGIDKQTADDQMQVVSTTSGSHTFPIKKLEFNEKSALIGTQAVTAITEGEPAVTVLESKAAIAVFKGQATAIQAAEKLSLRLAVSELDTKVVFMEKSDTLTCSLNEGVTQGGQIKSPQYERPNSVDRWTPLSEGSEPWFTGDKDLCYSDYEVEEELARETSVPEQDRCSLKLPMDILSYAKRQWKGQLVKSTIIGKGYAVLSQSYGCLQQVRGDNYSALRASLYQILMSTTQPPDWLQQETFLLIPEELEFHHGLIKGWQFPAICKQSFWIKHAVDRMKYYLGLLQQWWHRAAASPGIEGRRSVCQQLFQGGEDEFGVMEALKVLMLARAVELHTAMQRGDDVPIFCWLLFSRDSSPCPRAFLANHLSHVGISGGVEQVEMFLLGYALQHTMKVYRLCMADTMEFITYYPADHIKDWVCVCLVTKDDQHYDVAVDEPTLPQKGLSRQERANKVDFSKGADVKSIRPSVISILPSVTPGVAGHAEISGQGTEEGLVSQSLMEITVPEQDRCSPELPVEILSYAKRQWKGQLSKMIAIRKGYTVLSHSFRCLQWVRGDNYSVLRASLYQVLMSTTQPPDWLQQESFLLIPEELEFHHGLVKGWKFPAICKQSFWIKHDVDRMKYYLGLLQKWWHAAAASPGIEGRRSVCQQLFQGGEDEFGIMEALKVLMLARAVKLHTAMQKGDNVPIFCWLMFARDSCSCPHAFLANHLSHVGISGGMEKLEMFLLGYTLQHRIKVYHLHRVNTEEFITCYPVEHAQDWPPICLITEDDCHYNVPVGHPTHPLWRTLVTGQPSFLQQFDC